MAERYSSSFTLDELRSHIKVKRKRRWVKRFVVLGVGLIYYFKNPSSVKPRRILSLQGAKLKELPSTKTEYMFEVSKNPEYSLQIAFSSQSEYKNWLETISKYIQDETQSLLISEVPSEEDQKESQELLDRIHITPMQSVIKQRLREIFEKDYSVSGSKGYFTYACAGYLAPNKQSPSTWRYYLGIAAVWSLVYATLGAELSNVFGLGLFLWFLVFEKKGSQNPKANSWSFRCNGVINANLGQVMTHLHEFSHRSEWDPGLKQIEEGSKLKFYYKSKNETLTQEISRQFFKENQIYYLIEKSGPEIKNLFMLEDFPRRNKEHYTNITHYGVENSESNPLVGNSDILTCLKVHVESTPNYQTNSFVQSKDESDYEEEELEEQATLEISPETPPEKQKQMLEWNAEAIRVKKMAEELLEEKEGWEDLKIKSKDVKGFRRKAPGGLYIIRGEGEVTADVMSIINYLRDIERRKEYDEMFESGELVESISEQMEVMYQKFKKMTPVSSRDFCLLQTRFIYPDGRLMAVATSISHPDCPETKFVRAHLYMGCYVLIPVSEKVTRVVYMVHVDIRGSVPKFIINSVQSNQALVVQRIRDKFYNA